MEIALREELIELKEVIDGARGIKKGIQLFDLIEEIAYFFRLYLTNVSEWLRNIQMFVEVFEVEFISIKSCSNIWVTLIDVIRRNGCRGTCQ